MSERNATSSRPRGTAGRTTSVFIGLVGSLDATSVALLIIELLMIHQWLAAAMGTPSLPRTVGQ